MRTKLQKGDFIIKDLVVSMSRSGSGSTWLPGPDDETPPTPISPVASVLAHMDIIQSVRATTFESLKNKEGFESIGRAFNDGELGGDVAIRSAIQEIGTAVVASTVYSAMAGNGSVGLPNPECGGTSLETIPTPITPVIAEGRLIHRVTELPRLKQQLVETAEFIEKAVAAQFPTGEAVGELEEKLEGALEALRK